MTDLPELDPEEQRVLGSLLEKQVTVPASYPLSLNALRTACNQTSSRDPVVDYDEQTVEAVGWRLKDRGLLRIVWSDSGRRTLKYHQTLDEVLELADDERALLTVLLLRGPQAPGELRTRTDRLHAFADRHAVERVLAGMAERGLVREQPRRRGERDARWGTCSASSRPRRPRTRRLSPATACLPTAPLRATSGCARRTGRWRRPTRKLSSTSSGTGSRSRPGCSTGSRRMPTEVPSSRSAADRAT